ncbi:pyridoxal phosphate-dependent transferase [Phakopsora pachyrhizi]|uniref:Pyridoxal phosphate-dependent transferase n=1 Tax=Phakopsora pachyrhizi TaxID=170000 RepID=A0AAV0B3L1_PHAPC|nr:pyridoxal phosphate-dependent transferase [Phakopsora pachyrhizi]
MPLSRHKSQNITLVQPQLQQPEVQKLIDDETYQQFSGLELIASENLTSLAVMEANGSILTNKYSEGLPRAQYYGGDKFINKLEILCQNQALEASRLDPQSFPYSIDPESKLIDYEYLKKTAKIYKPRILIWGASAYPRDWDYKQLRKIADDQGAYLMMDHRRLIAKVCSETVEASKPESRAIPEELKDNTSNNFLKGDFTQEPEAFTISQDDELDKASQSLSIDAKPNRKKSSGPDPQSHNLPLNNSIAGQPACSITTAPPNQQIQQPPINANGSKLFDIDPNSLPSNMKKEGEDWMMMSNPKVEKVVDVGLVHTLVHNRFSTNFLFFPSCCMRYVKNNFLDGPRQDSYDLVTRSWNLKSNGNGDGRKEHEKQRFEGDGPKGRAKRVFDRDEFQMRTIDEGLDRFTGSPFGAVSLHAGSQ